MADSNASPLIIDPMSLILAHNSKSVAPTFLNLTSDNFFFLERGPRYRAYADLRESRLRMRNMKREDPPYHDLRLTPPKKQVKFQESPPAVWRRRAAAVAQSVPDFSAVLRKENRKPPPANVQQRLPPVMDRAMTPPVAKLLSPAGKSAGSRSASAVEKRRTGVMTRRSYAGGAEELKGLASAAQAAISGENRRGRISRNILGPMKY